MRVSRNEQSPEMQRNELEDSGCERISEESTSSREEVGPSSKQPWITADEPTPSLNF